MSGSDTTYDVLCYGTISMDNVTRLTNLPKPNRDAVATHEYNELGGEALQVAIPLAAWGLKVVVVGNFIGTDWKGNFIRQELARHPGIDTRYIRQHENVVTPFLRVLVTPDGERSRIMYWYDDTPKVELTEEMMREARILSVDAHGRGERDRAAYVARQLGRLVVSSDAIWPQYPLVGLSDVLIISNTWLQYNFPGAFEYDHALTLQDQGAGTVIITDGPQPVLVVQADGAPFAVEPYRFPKVVDTSGAGSLFKAGIIYGLLQEDWSLEYKVKFACAAAGLYCRLDRTEATPPTLAEIAALMRAQPR